MIKSIASEKKNSATTTGSASNEIADNGRVSKKSTDQSIETNSIISIIDLNTIEDETAANNEAYKPTVKKKVGNKIKFFSV